MRNLCLLFSFLLISTSLFSQSSSDYFNKAGTLLDQGFYEDATAYFSKAIEMEKSGSNKAVLLSAYVGKAQALMALGKYDEAILALNEVVKADPKEFSHAYRHRAKAKMKKGDMTGAIEDFTSSIQHEERDQESYFLRATIYKQQGKTAEACADFRRAAQYGNPDAREESLTICR